MTDPMKVAELDQEVFQRLPQLTPFWMEHERKWLILWCNGDDCDVERFDTKAEAIDFCARSLVGRADHEA